jgi:hypothetical protein
VKGKLAKKSSNWPRVNAATWQRTMAGNRYVVSKRLAGEEGPQKKYKHADLPQIQHKILVMLAGAKDGMPESEIAKRLRKPLALTQYHLTLLHDADMASDGSEDFIAVSAFSESDQAAGPAWELRQNGKEYLAERSLL